MKKTVSLFISILSLIGFSCKSDEPWVEKQEPKEISVYVSSKVPEIGYATTRAVNEVLISAINIVVFEDQGAGYRLSYIVPGYSITNPAPSQYDFYARLSPTEYPVKLYVLANVSGLTNTLSGGETEEQVRQDLVLPFTSTGLDGTLPMCGEAEFVNGITEDGEVDVEMLRAVARVDVINTAENFTLTSIQVYRAADRFQIVPNSIINEDVFTASIPAGTEFTVNTTQQAVTDNNSSGQVYLPESPLPAVADRREATVVVIGGLYNEETTPTYYRLDFVPDDTPDLFGQILRNHRYRFVINTVLAPGWRDPDEAAQYESTQIEAEIKVWNENTVYMVFDDIYYFGVSSRTFNVSSYNGFRQTVLVDTNLDSYELYWSDANGVVVENIDPIEPGGSFENGIYTAAISADGSRITVEASSASDTTAYLLVRAGRLRVLLTIMQELPAIANRSLNVYGSTTEIGSLGDNYIFGYVIPGERARGMWRIMTNKDNYGPDGTVSMQGISIAGQAGDQYPEVLLNMFDVIYLTYARNPNATLSNNILNWHNASNQRILMIQFDNPNITNSTILGQLGVADAIRRVTIIQPYTLYADAPDILTNGVFGPVASGLQYRCFDTTYSVIDLEYALSNGISPVLMANGGVLLGIDFNRRIIYSGDIDLYNNIAGGSGEFLNTTTGIIEDGSNVNAKRLIANLWAWIISVALTE